MYEEYLWIFVVSVFLAVFVAWGIGANDVVRILLLRREFGVVDCQYASSYRRELVHVPVQANSFGSSVGTKAFTMGQVIHLILTLLSLYPRCICVEYVKPRYAVWLKSPLAAE